MDLADVPRHRPLAFDKMESLIKEMQDPETGVPVRSQKLFLTFIPSAFMGYDLVEWLMERFNLDESSNVEAINLANQLCQYGYFFPVNDSKTLVLKDDSTLYRFQSPYYWPWQPSRVAGGPSAPTLQPDNVEYAIYLVKRTLRNKQRHGLEDYELEALANLKKNLAAKWDFITMQAEEQVRLAKDRKKGDKIVSDSQERAYWRVARPPPGMTTALEPCPVPVRVRHPRPKRHTIEQLTKEIELLKASLDRTRVKTSIALEALLAYSETFAPYDPWLTPPQPSNPWVSDDTLFWQINSPLVEVPSEKRVQRWALSIQELVSDPTGLQEFTSFLRKEYSHENIRFWLAVMDLRRSASKQIPRKLEEIYEEFLKPGAPCEINIDGATAERVAEGLRTGSRYALDHAAEHVYGLLLKKDCYPRFIRSDHFRRLLAEGKNVHQKKRFFGFGGPVKKKPGSTSGGGGSGSSVGSGPCSGASALTRRRGSDRSLSGSAHELAVCAAQPPRAPEPPPHSHSQSNLCDITFRDPLDDDTADALPWECAGRESVYGGPRRRQDSAADSGSSSSDVSAAIVAAGERTRRLPQQSTLDGGLRGAPPPLRRLSAVEPRHLAPLASPPQSPRPPRPAPQTAPVTTGVVPPPHPTPTISVSSAPDDEFAESPPETGSPEEPRSLPHSDDPPSVFASAAPTPTDPIKTPLEIIEDRTAGADDSLSNPSRDSCRTDAAATAVDTKVLHSEPSEASEKSGEPVRAHATSSVGSSDASRSVPAPAHVPPLAPAAGPAPIPSPAPASSAPVPSSPRGPAAESDRPSSPDNCVASAQRTVSRQSSTTKETSPASSRDVSSKIGDLPEGSHRRCSVRPGSERRTGSPGRAPRPAAGAAVAPLAVGEDIGGDDDNVDKVPSAPLQRVSGESEAASDSDPPKRIAHTDEASSVSDADVAKRDNKSDDGERKKRNDICPWEDENSCENDAPFVKTYATLGYL